MVRACPIATTVTTRGEGVATTLTLNLGAKYDHYIFIYIYIFDFLNTRLLTARKTVPTKGILKPGRENITKNLNKSGLTEPRDIRLHLLPSRSAVVGFHFSIFRG